MAHYLAVDIGAESGRLILGSLEGDTLRMREIHRFANGMIELNGHFHWNIARLYTEILNGIEKCVHAEGIVPVSIAIDTWGVDYGLLAEDGSLMGLPFAYRDGRTENAIAAFCAQVPKEEIYSRTGNLFASYNTLFQLYAATQNHPKLINSATSLLFIPDLLAYFLTGEKKTEFSFATTSQLFNRQTNSWDGYLIEKLDLSVSLFPQVVDAGTVIGKLNATVTTKINVPAIPVVAVASHDTASAIAAIPACGENWAFISSGTWSLMGIETDKPWLNAKTMQQNFTNEGGFLRKNYLLKNLMGLWVLQQARQSMARAGRNYDYPQLIEMAAKAEAFTAFIDIDHESFLNPKDMCLAIANFCTRTGQKVPENDAQFARVILESLALKYRQATEDLLNYKTIDRIYITGGGINNKLLCQFTADACQLPVTTVLAEGTAAGNLMVQAYAMGELTSAGSISRVMMNSCAPEKFAPANAAKWQEAYLKYQTILSK